MPLKMQQKKVSMDKLYGMSSMHLDSLKVVAINPPKISLGVKATWGSPLKIAGGVEAGSRPMPFSMSLQGTTFETQHIDATLNKDTGAITNFEVSGGKVNFQAAQANLQIHSPFFARIADNMINRKMNEQ